MAGARSSTAQEAKDSGVAVGVGGVDDFLPPDVGAERAGEVVAAPREAAHLLGRSLVGFGPPDLKVHSLRFG